MVEIEKLKLGDRLQVIDGSEAHHDIGTVWDIQNGVIVLLLDDQGCAWPCLPNEVKRYEKDKNENQ